MAHLAETGLVWGIKASFLAYLKVHTRTEQTMADGAGQLDSGEFYFTWSPEGGRLEFRGSVTFLAHGGLLWVPIVDPAIDESTGVLSIRTGDRGGRLPLMDLTMREPHQAGELLSWDSVATALRPEAVELFGGGYPAGTSFDPVSFRIHSN